MLLIKPFLIIDLISALWTIFVVTALFVWLPMASFSSGVKTNAVQILGLWLRIMSLIVVGVLSLSYFDLLNWITLVLWYGGCLFFNYYKSYRLGIKHCQEFAKEKIVNLIDILDSGLSITDVIKDVKNSCQKSVQRSLNYLSNLIDERGILFIVLLTIILIFAILTRWQYSLLELRFSQPDNYGILLITRQILTRNYPHTDLTVFPALAATISLLGSIEPMQTIRFFSPIIGVVLVISLGYVVWVFLDNVYSALIAMFALGIYLFTWDISIDRPWITTIIDSLNNSLIRQWAGNELELGVIFLLLSLGYCFSCDRAVCQTITFKFNLGCCVVLILLTAPPLLIILAISSIGLIGDKKLTLITITLAWIILAVFAAMAGDRLTWLQGFLLTLPVAFSFLTGILFTIVSSILKTLSPKWAETFCLGLIFSFSLNFWLPNSPKITYLEYDIAARKSIELNRLFPTKTWTLVAPVEQLAEIYGSGWYQDLALFVEQYAVKATKPQFNFPISDDLFIMVEKVPFVTFPDEPDILPDSILGDRTYGYYRSTAGRASLEYEALRMCEKYRLHHPDSDIYYEDEKLRIYHFKQTISYSHVLIKTV